jgi:hypothetical protein
MPLAGAISDMRAANIVIFCDWLLPGCAPRAANWALTFAVVLARVCCRI